MYYKNCIRDMALETIFQNFHINFLNSDFSLNKESNVTKLIGHVLCITPERSVSQNFDIGLGYIFMSCRKFVKVFFHYICLVFYIIKIKPGPKSKF